MTGLEQFKTTSDSAIRIRIKPSQGLLPEWLTAPLEVSPSVTANESRKYDTLEGCSTVGFLPEHRRLKPWG
jgi:hypothetical protein